MADANVPRAELEETVGVSLQQMLQYLLTHAQLSTLLSLQESMSRYAGEIAALKRQEHELAQMQRQFAPIDMAVQWEKNRAQMSQNILSSLAQQPS